MTNIFNTLRKDVDFLFKIKKLYKTKNIRLGQSNRITKFST